MLVQPLTSVPCERGFSFMARLQTTLRNKMTTDHLRDQMRIVANKSLFVPLKKYDFKRATDCWWAMRVRHTGRTVN